MLYNNQYHKKDLSDTSFLITGGSGFIGSNIVEYLLKYGAKKVRVVDNLLTSSYDNLKKFESNERFEFLKGDMRTFEVCVEAVKGMDVVTHQAALGSVPRSIDTPHLTNDHNVSGFVNLIQAAKLEGIKRIVYASSSSVYGDDPTLPKEEDKVGNPLSPYAVSKKTMEIYSNVFADLYGMELIGLRYFNVFGPNQSPKGAYAAVIPLFVDGIIENSDVFVNGDGEQSRDFTFIENVVQANILALLTDNEEAVNQLYNVAYGDRYTVNDLFFSIAKLLGSDQKPVYRAERAGDIKHSLANTSKAQDLLGYKPLFNLQTGLEISLEYYKNLVV